MKIPNFRLFKHLQNSPNPTVLNSRWLILVIVGLMSLGVSIPVLAERKSDVERLISTNQCQQCDLSQANLADAKLEGADLLGANLQKANLRGANLKGADLSSANLIEADLSGADLRDTKLHSTTLRKANLKDAAEKLIWGKFVNCGQTCIAPDYILVPEEKKEAFINQAQIAMTRYYDPEGKGVMQSPDYARLINRKHFDRIRQMLDDAIQKGAKIEVGGDIDEETKYIAPTLISGIGEDMLVYQEEIFGPILPILTYTQINDALALIHSQPKPLALYFFGKDDSRAKRVMTETSSGNLVINDCVLHFLHSELPFGGVNNSGIGKAHGKFGFLAFSNEKGVLKQRIGFNNVSLLRPPYGIRVKKLIATMMKWF